MRRPRPPSFAMSRSASVPECCKRPRPSFGSWNAAWPRIPRSATPPPRIWLATSPRCATVSPRRPTRPSEPRPNNLPVQRTAFIGREHEATALRQLLSRADVQLVTLTGPGGIGKTRLALQVAADTAAEFPGRCLLRASVGGERSWFDRFHDRASVGGTRNRESVAAGKLERVCERHSTSRCFCCSTTSSTSSPPRR